MRDSEVVASIVAGDPEGLAVAYDRYSGPLFGYCQSLLRQPDDAADAVQDTFVIAASKLDRLRDPERLRAWLFAVARNECLHRLKSRKEAPPLDDLPEQPDESADVGVEAERAESRALIRAAVAGLNDGERDVINQLWHGLEVPEVADGARGLQKSRPLAFLPSARPARGLGRGAARRPLRARRLRRARPAPARLGRAADGRPAQAGRAAYRPVRRVLGPAAAGARARAAARPRPGARCSGSAPPGAASGRCPGSAAPAPSAGRPRRRPGSAPTCCTSPPIQVRTRRRTAGQSGIARVRSMSMVFRGHRRAGTSGSRGWRTCPLSAAGGTVAAATATVVVLAVVPHAAHTVTAGGGPGGRLATAPDGRAAATSAGTGTARGVPLADKSSASATRAAGTRRRTGPSPSPSATASRDQPEHGRDVGPAAGDLARRDADLRPDHVRSDSGGVAERQRERFGPADGGARPVDDHGGADAARPRHAHPDRERRAGLLVDLRAVLPARFADGQPVGGDADGRRQRDGADQRDRAHLARYHADGQPGRSDGGGGPWPRLELPG